ncbi:MAG: hypothetical protein HYX24_05640 [Candidatus Aenigmarchaeota archaeon]|nr:hypothetical protein [Candidatus Aenigmarchaeota archaeon]
MINLNNRWIRIEKSIFLEVKEFVFEKVLFIRKLFFLVPLPVPGLKPPPIGLSVNSGATAVQVFDLNGRLVVDTG